MAEISIREIEVQLDDALLFRVEIVAAGARREFAIGIEDQGSLRGNELAVLRAAFEMADEIGKAVRHRLGTEPAAPA